MRGKTLLIGVVGIVIGVLLSTAVVFAGSLNPGSGPGDAGSQMYTLQQIYDRLTSGAAGTKMTAFTEPATGPSAGTMRTLDEVMAVAQPRALAPRVAKTGQNQCWDAAGALTDCAGTGQDGEYQRGIDPVIAPSDGPFNTPAWSGVRFTDNGDGTVTDNLTALVWLKNANCFGGVLWQAGLTVANTLASGVCGLSDGSSAGQWRMPNANEMNSLIDLTQSSPALPLGHPFTSVQAGSFYWSSTSYSPAPVVAYSVRLSDGSLNFAGKTNSFNPVWPVRGGQ